MPLTAYHYPDKVPEEHAVLAKAMYAHCRTFRTRQGNPSGKYNVAVFCVQMGDDITGYITHRSNRDENLHSEDSIVEFLAEKSFRKSQIVAVFSEWPPCKRQRETTTIDETATTLETYTPHPCSIMLDNVLLEGTPVFFADGPVM